MASRKFTAALGLFACMLGGTAWADIYSYTTDDGAVMLSNVPADARYTALITEPRSLKEEPPVALDTVFLAARKSAYDVLVDEVSRRHGLDSALLHAVISVESRYDTKAVSRKGAAGLMQLMPHTAKRYGARDAFDPRQNINAGARYLKDLLRMFHNDVSLALAAYNAGEQAVLKSGGRIPPYGETLRYVPKVLDYYRLYQRQS